MKIYRYIRSYNYKLENERFHTKILIFKLTSESNLCQINQSHYVQDTLLQTS